jgi:hypothetical protein
VTQIFFLAALILGCFLTIVTVATTRCYDLPGIVLCWVWAILGACIAAGFYHNWDIDRRRRAGEIVERNKP